MKEEFIKLILSIKDKTGFASEPMKIQAAKDIIIESMKWLNDIGSMHIYDEKLLIGCEEETRTLENNIKFIKNLKC